MERLANIFHLGLKELRSLQRDIALVLLIATLRREQSQSSE